jgi:hypothetical protein
VTLAKGQGRKVSFSEEKKRKTSYVSAAPTPLAMAAIYPLAQESKVFWFFFRKRTFLP